MLIHLNSIGFPSSYLESLSSPYSLEIRMVCDAWSVLCSYGGSGGGCYLCLVLVLASSLPPLVPLGHLLQAIWSDPPSSAPRRSSCAFTPTSSPLSWHYRSINVPLVGWYGHRLYAWIHLYFLIWSAAPRSGLHRRWCTWRLVETGSHQWSYSHKWSWQWYCAARCWDNS